MSWLIVNAKVGMIFDLAKIIKEGQPIAAPPDVWIEMEKADYSLAKAVGYTNASTVKQFYLTIDKKFNSDCCIFWQVKRMRQLGCT